MVKFPEEPTPEQLADACTWLKHDFGVKPKRYRLQEMDVMREYWRAIWKAVNTPGRGGQFAPSSYE